MDDTSAVYPRPSPVQVVEPEREQQHQTLVPVPTIDIETIRNGVDQLAESQSLDKDSALAMTRLFHSLETLMRYECTRRDAQISKMESELERARIQHELDRIANAQYHQPHLGVEATPMRSRSKSKW